MLSSEAEAILHEMYTEPKLRGADGLVEIDRITRIDKTAGAELNRLVRESGARKSLEIGLAYGFSTIWIMDALPPEGSHVALDPCQASWWHGVGETQARRLPGKQFRWLEEYSIHALSDWIRAGEKFDFIFIDGAHRFDDVLVDFYLCDQVLEVGGLMVFDDVWMASIRTVLAFVLANRAYQVVPQRSNRMAALRKLKDDDRDWRHFRPFAVTTRQQGGLG
jgi:predicted O-methyltransferase YrrM